MNILVVLIVVLMVGAIIFLSRSPSDQRDVRKEHLKAMADLLSAGKE